MLSEPEAGVSSETACSDRAISEMRTLEFTVLDNVLSAGEVDTALAAILRLHASDDGVHAKQRAAGSKLFAHVEMIPNKGRCFETYFLKEKVLNVVSTILGTDFIANDLYSVALLPGYPGRDYHIDEPVRSPGYPLAVNVLYPLVDFTSENGATRFVPGSHLRNDEARPDEAKQATELSSGMPAEVRLEAAAGSAMLIMGSVLHASGANTSRSTRPALASLFSVPWMKQYTDLARGLKGDVLARASHTALQLFGFGSVVPTGERWNWDETRHGRPLQWIRPESERAGVGAFDRGLLGDV